MELPLRRSNTKVNAFWFFLAIAVLGLLVMRFWPEGLNTSLIIDFEMAKTAARAEEIMRGWSADLRGEMLKSIYADFLFIVGYSCTLFYACRIMAHASKHPILKKAGDIFSFGAIAAGICDVLENIGMLVTIRQHAIGWLVHFTYDMALVKFSLLFIVVMFVLISAFFWLLRNK